MDISWILPTAASALTTERLLVWSNALLDAADAWYRGGLDTSVLALFQHSLVPPIVLGLSVVLFGVRWYRSRSGGRLIDAAHSANLLVFSATLVLVAGYLLSSGGTALAATRPSQVGWPAAAGGFLLAAVVALNLTLHLLDTLQDFAIDGGFSWRAGLLAWPIGLLALLLAGWLVPWAAILVVAIFGTAQLLQIGVAVRGLGTAVDPWMAVVAVTVYLLGAVSTVMLWLVLLHLLVPVMILVGLLALPAREGVTTASTTPRRTCAECHRQLSQSEGSMSGRICSNCRYWQERRLRGEA